MEYAEVTVKGAPGYADFTGKLIVDSFQAWPSDKVVVSFEWEGKSDFAVVPSSCVEVIKLASGPVLGELRIGVLEDHDFSLADWDESLRDEVQKDLDTGVSTAYQIDIERAVPGGWEYISGLGGSVHNSGFIGTYSDASEITDESLRETVQEVWTEALAILKDSK